MKKRILSIVLTICMVLSFVPAMPTVALAADTCTCLIRCTDVMDADCPVCKSEIDNCTGRIRWVDKDGESIVDYKQLEALMTLNVGYHDGYYYSLDWPIVRNVGDSTVLAAVPKGADLVIDLNGKTLDGNNKGTIFEVKGKLTIIDMVGTGKIINATGGAFHILEGGKVVMQGGTIENCTKSGGVTVESGGTFEMTGGTIKSNKNLILGKEYIRNITVNGSGTVTIGGNSTKVLCCDQSDCGCSGNHIYLSKFYGSGGTELIPTLYFANMAEIKGNIYNEGTIIYSWGANPFIYGHINNFGTIAASTENAYSGMCYASVTNNGSISDGRFLSTVTNNGLISGGFYKYSTINNGSISNGWFVSPVTNNESGLISGGLFDRSSVTNHGLISGGSFYSEVDNKGTISGGMFFGTVETANGTIKDSAYVPVYFVTETGKVLATVKVLRGKSIPSANLPSVDPQKYGYNTIGWRNGSEDFSDGDRFTEDENFIYAKFSDPINYTITYSGGGTATPANPTSYTVECDTITLNNPTENGYIFTGWSGTDLSGNNNMTVTIPKGSTGNREYTAHFIDKHLYEVGTESDLQTALNKNATTIKLRADITLSSTLDLSDRITTLDLNGYTLTGDIMVADTSEGLLSIFTLTDSSSAANGVLTGNITLTRGSNGTASWLYANGGTVTGKVSMNSYVAKIYCTSDTPTAIKGYAGNYGEIRGGIFYGNINTGCIKEKTVTFMNGSSRYALEVVADGSNVAAPIEPTREGYLFDGWYNGDTKYTFGSPLSDSITLTATFSDPIPYTIEYDLDGGTATNPATYTVESEAITLNNPTKTGYIFAGWSGTGLIGNNNMNVTIPKGSTGNRTYTAHFSQNRYTVTFNTDGGTEIASKTPVKWEDKVLDGITDPTKDGWKFIGWKYGDVTVMSQTTYKELAADATVTSIELKAQWEDITAPTGEIGVGTNSWKAFLNKITFGLFFKDTQTVTITASDNSGGEVTVSYLLSDKALTADDLAEKEFTAYTGGFDIEPNNEWIIYVMLTDKAGNVTYLSSDGIVLDNVAPVISGVKNGKIYCGAQTVTVDEKYIDSVTVNGTEITLQNNQFTLPAAEGTQKIVATDKAGNVSAEITLTVNNGHTDENKDHKCDSCDENVGVHEDKNKDHKCEYCGEEVTTCKDDDKDHLCDICGATLSEHTGGEATCKDKAVCDYCGKEYSDFDSDKHTGGTEIRDAKAESCTETGYTGDTFCVGCGEKLSEGEVIPKLSHKDKDKDHLCDVCRIRLSEHTGGTATCTEKAVCEYCHKEYGELDSENHAGGTKNHGEAPATYLSDGYTGDIYCVGCKKMLSTGEVIPKLTHDDPTHGVKFYTNCSADGHNYKAYKWPATEFTMGCTQYICDKCGDEYWDNYTKKDTSEVILMPSGKDFEFYITPNLNSTINKDNVKNNPILQAFLQDPSGTLKRMEDDGIKMYKIIDGAEQTVESKSENIVFRSDAPFKEFDQVMINGLVLDKKYYSVKKGSTIVTLNEDFAKQIPTGMHLFGIISKDGVAITTFTVDTKAAADNDTKSPQTGDNSMLWLWVALLFVSGGVIGTTIVRKKEKRSEN